MIKTEIQEKKSLSLVSQKCYLNREWTQLVYGQEAILPFELELPSLRLALEERLDDSESHKKRIVMLEKFDKIRGQVYLNTDVNTDAIQKWLKTYYDSKLKKTNTSKNDLVLHYDIYFQKT